MSQTDSFIDEVTEEVKRDRLFQTFRKYGWIAILAVLLIVGGTAWREWQSARFNAQAEATGDAILSALDLPDAGERIEALQALAPEGAESRAVVAMLIAAEQGSEDEEVAAAETLQSVAGNPDLPPIYRQIATYKALAQGGTALPVEERRLQLEAMAQPGNPLRLLAEEQLALIDIETGDTASASERLQRIAVDAEATAGLRLRASRLMLALGVEPDPA